MMPRRPKQSSKVKAKAMPKAKTTLPNNWSVGRWPLRDNKFRFCIFREVVGEVDANGEAVCEYYGGFNAERGCPKLLYAGSAMADRQRQKLNAALACSAGEMETP